MRPGFLTRYAFFFLKSMSFHQSRILTFSPAVYFQTKETPTSDQDPNHDVLHGEDLREDRNKEEYINQLQLAIELFTKSMQQCNRGLFLHSPILPVDMKQRTDLRHFSCLVADFQTHMASDFS